MVHNGARTSRWHDATISKVHGVVAKLREERGTMWQHGDLAIVDPLARTFDSKLTLYEVMTYNHSLAQEPEPVRRSEEQNRRREPRFNAHICYGDQRKHTVSTVHYLHSIRGQLLRIG